ncbi:unnamed protein product [Ceutorhynchus assimilis]|uniref:DUF4780 domain-containing protein n=1 Tax=Ceutorhynchus assimilis TaxID=467358 RepID=A0A9N9MI20_9CUCU|nr:unnamed protein product [Ceutorhynchus assimilis]
MICGNEATKNWLGQAMKGLGELWQGANLKSVETKRPLVLTFIPRAESVEKEVIRAPLSKQNREADWILKSKKAKKGLTLTYFIEEASFGANQFKVFYGLARLNFKVLRGLNGGDQSPSNKPAAMGKYDIALSRGKNAVNKELIYSKSTETPRACIGKD